jgi:hypothetical protein
MPLARIARPVAWAALWLAGATGLAAGAGGQQLALKRVATRPQASACPVLPLPRQPGAADREEARQRANLGQEAAIVGNQRAAREQFRRAAQLDPSNEEIAYQYGRTLEDCGEPRRGAARVLPLHRPRAGERRRRGRAGADRGARPADPLARGGRPGDPAVPQRAHELRPRPLRRRRARLRAGDRGGADLARRALQPRAVAAGPAQDGAGGGRPPALPGAQARCGRPRHGAQSGGADRAPASLHAGRRARTRHHPRARAVPHPPSVPGHGGARGRGGGDRLRAPEHRGASPGLGDGAAHRRRHRDAAERAAAPRHRAPQPRRRARGGRRRHGDRGGRVLHLRPARAHRRAHRPRAPHRDASSAPRPAPDPGRTAVALHVQLPFGAPAGR